MRTMIDLGSGQRGPGLHVIIDTPTSVDCGGGGVIRELRLRRSLRALVDRMFPTCCALPPTTDFDVDADSVHSGGGSTTVTATIFGYRRGRVSFCVQEDVRAAPLLLLEFSVPTSYLAREMQHGHLRIALECDLRRKYGDVRPCSLYEVPVWCLYCNGRKVGFAVRRQATAGDTAMLKHMQSVSVGAGVLPVKGEGAGVLPVKGEEDGGRRGELMYLRASFERVVGSADSESFHMVNPVGSSCGQELSIFLLRS